MTLNPPSFLQHNIISHFLRGVFIILVLLLDHYLQEATSCFKSQQKGKKDPTHSSLNQQMALQYSTLLLILYILFLQAHIRYKG